MPSVSHYPHLWERVQSQQELVPALYGEVDFGRKPYRLALGIDDESTLPPGFDDRRTILDDERSVELISTCTMLGDVVADPYAALMAEYTFKRLIDMLKEACAHGIDAVEGAPWELRRFLASMEDDPSWLDMELVHEGARQSRLPAALIAPLVTRGAFLATFMNTYAALPMALTGALGGQKAARRVNETSSFFTVTAMPGALDRNGPGFEAAAMVRLMHSMVRYNALKRSDKWDLDVYGVPIPQVDQMPAGLINVYLLAANVLKKGRTEFTTSERAVVEFGRYRCHLLGLPEELLPETPDAIIRVMHARAALLRDGFDDDTCGELVRATMAAHLRPTRSLPDRVGNSVEKSYSKAFFIRAFAGNDRKRAAEMGVDFGVGDLVRIAATAPFHIARFAVVNVASQIPVVQKVADSYLTRLLGKRLVGYGRAEYTTDASTYSGQRRGGVAAAAAVAPVP